MEKDYKYLVRVSCLTYNHAPYIVDALNGFTMQQTNFPFVCTIIDDDSTDGEQEVIRAYLEEHFDMDDNLIAYNEETDDYVLTFARHKTNFNCYFAVIYLKYNHYNIKKSKQPYVSRWSNTKYIAKCEGDDYWIYKHKLQKQIDILESNKEYVMCCHESLHLKQNNGRLCYQQHEILKHYPNGFTFDLNYYPWITNTLTLVYRTTYKYKKDYESMRHKLDVSFIYYIKKSGKCYLMPDIMSVYRIHKGGICSGESFQKLHQKYMDINVELIQHEKSKQAYRYFRLFIIQSITQLSVLREWRLLYNTLQTYYSWTNTYNKIIIIPLIFLKCVPKVLGHYFRTVINF